MKATLNLSDNVKSSQKEKFQRMTQEQLNERMLSYASKGWSAFIAYLLFSPEMKLHAQLEYKDYTIFRLLALQNNQELIDFLLQSELVSSLPFEKKKMVLGELFSGLAFQFKDQHDLFTYYFDQTYTLAHQDFIMNNLLTYFCKEGNLTEIEYIMTHPSTIGLVEKSNKNKLLLLALENFHLPVFHYLLTSSHFVLKAQIHYEKNFALRTIFNPDPFILKMSKDEALKKLKPFQEYLIYDYKIKLTLDREKILNKFKQQDIIKKIEQRDLMFSLEKNLTINSLHPKAKI